MRCTRCKENKDVLEFVRGFYLYPTCHDCERDKLETLIAIKMRNASESKTSVGAKINPRMDDYIK